MEIKIFYKGICLVITCVAVCFSLFGCDAAAVYGVGKTYLNKEAAPVYLTEDEKEISGCEFLKHVESSTAWGGLALQDEALQRVISDITHETFEAGGDVLLVKETSKSFMGSSASGEAYRCGNGKEMPISKQN